MDVAQFLISCRLPLIDAAPARALPLPPASNLHTERKGKVSTRDTFLPNKQQSPIARHNGAVSLLPLARARVPPSLSRRSLPSLPFHSSRPSSLSPVRTARYFPFPRRTDEREGISHKEANKSAAAAQVRLFIKKFLLHPARQKHTSLRRLGRPLEKPVFSAATITTTGRFLSRDIALQYYIILRRYVEFRLFGFNERDSPENRASRTSCLSFHLSARSLARNQHR